jgi:hypothetical protein
MNVSVQGHGFLGPVRGNGNSHDLRCTAKIIGTIIVVGIEIIVGNNVLKDGTALQDAVDCGAMILFEKANVSKEKNVKDAILKATSCGINVLSIVLEK